MCLRPNIPILPYFNTPFSFSCASYQIRSCLGMVGIPVIKLLQLFRHMWEGYENVTKEVSYVSRNENLCVETGYD
jgi:hypothetical protein